MLGVELKGKPIFGFLPKIWNQVLGVELKGKPIFGVLPKIWELQCHRLETLFPNWDQKNGNSGAKGSKHFFQIGTNKKGTPVPKARNTFSKLGPKKKETLFPKLGHSIK